ncbi:hypothetical protein [uncultured Holdemanella sp.]|uniref:hypothetical protein n=1 Tax=uncultured Holdemanella sp. TaxID=1763549 RepID=UPI0025F172FB|nr:hypothetical protein [uncultured Holdemanella sp.]
MSKEEYIRIIKEIEALSTTLTIFTLLPQILYLAIGRMENLFLRCFCFRTSVMGVTAIESKGKGTKYRFK